MSATSASTFNMILEQIYDCVDRREVFRDLKPSQRGNYIACTCPNCGQPRAFIKEDGNVLRCNRINSCGYQATILQFVAGDKKPRGKRFVRAVNELCDIAGIQGPAANQNPPIRKRRPQKLAKPKTQPIKVDTKWLNQVVSETKQRFAKNRLAQEYLTTRGIPVELAQRFDVGYAPYGKWPHYNEKGRLIRNWRPGRICFPTRQSGQVINIYGRVAGQCPKRMRHDFFAGPKGVWNAQALAKFGMVYMPEGVFDALSLMAAGKMNTSAINGCHSINWKRVRARVICFCMDPDAIGGKRWLSILTSALKAKKKVVYLPKSVFCGYKDLNHLWQTENKIRINVKPFNPTN